MTRCEMRIYVILAALSIFILGIGAQAALYEKIENGSMKIIIKDNNITIKMKNQDGNYKTATFAIDKFVHSDLADNFDTLSNIYIKDELLIDGDKIVIDGQTFTSEEIQNIQVLGEFNRGFSVAAHLPHDDYSLGGRKVVEIESKSASDRVGFGDLIIDAGETIYGDVVSIAGNVKVYGIVQGDIVSVFGNIEMHDGAAADGDVIAPFGQVTRIGAPLIGGDTTPSREYRAGDHDNTLDLNMTARFNRVEGLTPLCGLRYTDSYNELPEFHFNFGYAFALKKWDLDAGLRQEFGSKWAFYFGGNVYQGVVTPDEWIISTAENTFAGLLFKEDFQDFYYHKGIRGFVGQKILGDGFIQADLIAEKDESVTRHTNKAIFGGDKNFRQNYSTVADKPAALESINGDLHQLAFTLGWDTRDDIYWPRVGQYAELEWQSAGDGLIGSLGGDHNYDRVQIALADYLRVNRKQHLALRIKAGYSDSRELPLNKWFFIGGLSSLRGYEYKEFAGNRFFLLNIDHYFEFSEDFAIILFADAGKAGFSKSQFSDMDLKTDLGVGVLLYDFLQIDLAQRLDNSDKSPVVTVRAFLQY